MPNYRRAYLPGGTFFFTLVTYERRPLLTTPHAVTLLRRALARAKQEMPFTVTAAVVLPAHLHFMWTLPPEDSDFSKRVGRFNVLFTQSLRDKQAMPLNVSSSRLSHHESNVWQRRFWEHTVRDEQDLQRHLDYIHYNPIKHRLVTCPHLWPYSSFQRWVKDGAYAVDWCCTCGGRQAKIPDFADMES